jgi:hypothetical protein
MNICDKKDCPAAAESVIITQRGSIELCGHHTRENEADFRAKGYMVQQSFWLVRTLPDGKRLMRDHNGATYVFERV